MNTENKQPNSDLIGAIFINPDSKTCYVVECIGCGGAVAILCRREFVPVDTLKEKWERYTEFDGVIEQPKADT